MLVLLIILAMKLTETEKEQITKGVLGFAVMSQLEREEQYGIQLLGNLQKTPLKTKAGTLYPLLNKLHKTGAITHRWETSAFGPARKYYQITPAGKKHLSELRAHWKTITKVIEGK